MLLLVVDSSGKNGSVGLAKGDPDGTCKLIDVVRLDGAFSAQLIPHIAGLLSKNAYAKADIGAFVAVSGPGSFTGLRVGLSAVKGLAEVLLKPTAEVSLLEALAAGANANGMVFAAIDAGRGHVYLGEYEVSPDTARRINERLVTEDEFIDLVRGVNVVISGDLLSLLAESAGAITTVVSASLDLIAAVGWKKVLDGNTVSPENLEANYISRPNAEVLLSASIDPAKVRD